MRLFTRIFALFLWSSVQPMIVCAFSSYSRKLATSTILLLGKNNNLPGVLLPSSFPVVAKTRGLDRHLTRFPTPNSFHLSSSSKTTTTTCLAKNKSSSDYSWDGDDLRRLSKWRRRLWRSYQSPSNNYGTSSRGQPVVRNTLLVLNVLSYIYQVVNTIQWIAQRFPSHWPKQALTIVSDTVWGSTAVGPLTRDFWYTTALARAQPHRYLTAGFVHGNILHLLVNMDALRRLPSWLETGLGSTLYLTAFCVAVVLGNCGHAYLTPGDTLVACLGASGGICGLYGLEYAALVKMGNDRAAWQVLRGMGRIVLAGLLLSNVSNAAHVAGFCGGFLVGLVLGPSYGKSYTARRKWSLDVDTHSRDYRAVMGFGVEPKTGRRGRLSLLLVWLVALAYGLGDARLRTAPLLIWQGLTHPGSLTSWYAKV